MANQRRIHGFNLSLVHERTAAADILHDASVLLWEKFHRFEPGKTFIVPAVVGAYTIRPYRESKGQECATLKAFVRT